MKLNHINLCSTDVATLSDFFCRHFAFKLLQAGKVPEGMTKGPLPPGSSFALLQGSDDFSLIITEIGQDSPKSYPTDFHLGFTIDTPDAVRAKHQELCESRWTPEPINTFEAMGKSWTAFYCPVGDGIRLEVNAFVNA